MNLYLGVESIYLPGTFQMDHTIILVCSPHVIGRMSAWERGRESERDLWRSEWFNLGFQNSLILQVLTTSSPYVKMNEFWDLLFFLKRWMDAFYSVVFCECVSEWAQKHTAAPPLVKRKLCFVWFFFFYLISFFRVFFSMCDHKASGSSGTKGFDLQVSD